jgi:hypothetical protein
MGMTHVGQNLAILVDMSERLKQVCKTDLQSGDCVLVQTCNSLYTMRVIGEGWFEIVGGWFDRKGKSPMRVRINGCTWGGSAIKLNVAAACGLCLEFGNRVVTSPIKKISIFPNGSLN